MTLVKEMADLTIEELYQHIKVRPLRERLTLAALISQDAAVAVSDQKITPKRSLLELRGLGAEIWQGINAQAYVDEMRNEWDTVTTDHRVASDCTRRSDLSTLTRTELLVSIREEVLAAEARIRPHVLETPLIPSPVLSLRTASSVLFEAGESPAHRIVQTARGHQQDPQPERR